MNNTAPSRWRHRPNTAMRTFKQVSREASVLGLCLNAAMQAACAGRNGRFWLTDPARKVRVATASNLVEVAAALALHRLNMSQKP